MNTKINTNKVMFVGDPHLDSTTPSSRIDDYSLASIDKLYALKNLCITRDVKLVVILGDVFNKHDQSNSYVNRVMQVFKSFKKEGILVVSITGNHDISYEKLDTLERSPLGMLYTADLIVHLDSVSIDTGLGYLVGLFGLDYPDSPLPIEEQSVNVGRINILACHRFYNYGFNDPHNITSDDCVSLGYNVYAMGHDHIKYETEKLGERFIIRPGSFMRTSSHRYNLERTISVDTVVFSGSSDLPQITVVRDNIPCKPASEVFSSSIYQRDVDRDINLEMESLGNRVDQMLQQMESKHSSKDLFAVLDEVCTDTETKKCVENYLNIGGYSRDKQTIS